MINVICDTMIWYELYDNTISFDKSKFRYFGTTSNIVDFLASDKLNLYDNAKQSLLNAIKSMHEHADDVVCIDPVVVGAKQLFGIEANDNDANGIRLIYQKLINYANNGNHSLHGPGVDAIINSKDIFRVGVINSKINLLKEFSTKNLNDQQKSEFITGTTVNWLLEEFNNILGTNYQINEINSWDPVRVFINTYVEFIKAVNINQPPNKNSMVDLLQLLYIGNHGQTVLWTKEEKLLAKIKSSFKEVELKNILYQYAE